MSNWVLLTAVILAQNWIYGRYVQKRPRLALWYWGAYTVLATGVAAYELTRRHWLDFGLCVLWAALGAFLFWLYWKKRKRKFTWAMFGAKSQALLGRLVVKQKEAEVPVR